MRQITVRIIGTGCFVDVAAQQKRLVLPFDNLQAGDKKHIAYVEFADINIKTGVDRLQGPYKHTTTGRISYHRFALVGHVVKIENIIAGSLRTTPSFDMHVPKMTVVHRGLYPRPRQECFGSVPNPQKMAAFLDIASGILMAGQLYEFITSFQLKDTTETAQFQTPKYVDLLVPVEDGDITVTFSKPNVFDQVVLKGDTDLITIGNQPELDITGNGSGDDVKHDFNLYYNQLADDGTVGNDPPLPVKHEDPVNSCTVTNWP
jgi:hypothetical protein